MASNTRSKSNSESGSQSELGDTTLKGTNGKGMDEDFKQHPSDKKRFIKGKWEVFREHEQQRLKSIKALTEEEMSNIDQWLSIVQHVYDDIQYPMTSRVRQSVIYLQENEQTWYEQEKDEIKQDWNCFCKKLKQYTQNRLKSVNENPMKDHSILSTNEINRFERKPSSSTEKIPSLASNLALTMAREIIKSPTYFRGSKDDVIEWLERLETRFKMANWDDEQKLCYISIHLQDDAYRWWTHTSGKITSWFSFTEAIKQAFGSTKAKELAFEQLRCYKQAINQSMTQYYDKIIELCRRSDPSMSDSMKLQYLMAGVKESLKLFIALHDPQSPESFLSYARKVEDTLALTNTEYNPLDHELNQETTFNQPSTLSTIKSQSGDDHRQADNNQQKSQSTLPTGRIKSKTNVGSRDNSSNYTTYKRNVGICYACGTPGHYYRDCTRPRFV